MRSRDARFAPLLAALVCAQAHAGDAPKASVEAGRALLSENSCNGACHQSYAEDNDPLTLYTRADRKVRNRSQLDAQVHQCVARLGAMVFPEDTQSLSDALDADYYRFSR